MEYRLRYQTASLISLFPKHHQQLDHKFNSQTPVDLHGQNYQLIVEARP